MNKSDKVTLDLAEKICKRKFDQTFGNLEEYKHLDKDSAENLFKQQIQLWKDVGQTHLSVKEIEELSPIKQALYYLCKDKINFCMSKILLM